MSSSSDVDDGFAVVGLSFKLPQDAVDVDSFWNVMEERRNLMTDWPEDRAKLDSFNDGTSDKPNTLQTFGAHFTKDDPGVFDAPFFSITAKDAAAIDPQQRWVLEAAYLAFENAGIPIESLRDSMTGVFGASMFDDYLHMLTKDPDAIPRQAITGLAPALLANRLSWYFQLRGPSVHINAACSSSMIALDMACKAMRGGDATAALVVGSNALLSPESSLFMSNMNVLSPDSKCFSFDARANGYARGEGVIALVLKPLRDAIKNGDVIRAVIRASASNQDGRTPVLTQPSADAQELLIRHVYEKAGLDFSSTRYVEAHGTGTPAGDPVEMTAIGKVFRESRSPQEPLYVGTVKPNIGHLEGASGLASFLKAILVLEKGIIPPTALFETMNPQINADFYNVQVPTRCIPWPSPGLRRVSVNCFGSGGSNAHIILDDALNFLQSRGIAGYHHCVSSPSIVNAASNGNMLNIINDRVDSLRNGNYEKRDDSYTKGRRMRLLVWTAADSNAVRRTLTAYQDYWHRVHLTSNNRLLDQLAYTLASRRSILPWRTFAVTGKESNTNSSLDTIPASQPVRISPEGTGIAFVFTGQGAQYTGMGLELLQYPLFKKSLEQSDKILASLGCQWSVFSGLRDAERIHDPDLSQPLCTILQIALVDLLTSFNVVPVTVVGHSSGEIAAAYAAGALSQRSACKIAYFRGLVARSLRSIAEPPGAMISVNLTESEVPSYLSRLNTSRQYRNDKQNATGIHIACFNSPTNLTLSGPADIITALKDLLDEEGVFAHKINTGIAYHSPAMRVISAQYLQLMGSLDNHGERSGPGITIISSVTGGPVEHKLLTRPQYWVDNLLSPVRFTDAVLHLARNANVTDLVEIGPHSALKRPVCEGAPSMRYHSMLTRSKSPVETTLSLAGTLFCSGYPLSILAANGQTEGEMPFLVDCPPYPFDHSRRYWHESRLSKDFRLRTSSRGYLLGRRAHDWNPLQPRWRNWLSVEAIPWLADHVVSGTTILPGTGMLVMAIEAVSQTVATNTNARAIAGFLFKQATFLAPITVGGAISDATETELRLNPVHRPHEKESTWYSVRIFSHSKERWSECFQADIQVQFEETSPGCTQVDGGREKRLEKQSMYETGRRTEASCSLAVDSRAFYDFTHDHGNAYGEAFQLLTNIVWDGNRAAAAKVDMTQILTEAEEQSHSPVHPAVLDTLMQLLFAQVSCGLAKPVPTLVPQRLANAWFPARTWKQATRFVSVSFMAHNDGGGSGSTGVEGTVYALGDDGTPLCAIEHLVAAQVAKSGVVDQNVAQAGRNLLYNLSWKPQLSSIGTTALQRLIHDIATVARSEVDTTTDILEEIYPQAELAMRMATRKALDEVSPEEIVSSPSHIRKYAALLRRVVDSRDLDETLGELALKWLLDECDSEFPKCRILPTVARALPSVLRGEIDPLNLLFSSGAAESFYDVLFQQHVYDGRLKTFMDLLSHENPKLRILEVGAGTGGLTRLVLDILWDLEKRDGFQGTRFAEYTYTDISSAFFDAARRKFVSAEGRGVTGEESRITFKTFNLEKEPADQVGFDDSNGLYDVIIAGSVLHATTNLASSLGRIRKLLKPGGRLIIQEITSPESACINVGFGLLEGWWMGTEEWRLNTPLATVQQWDELLLETGFSGADLTLENSQHDGSWFSSIMVSTAVAGHQRLNGLLVNGDQHHSKPELEVIVNLDSTTQRDVAATIADQYPQSRIVSLEHIRRDEWKPSTATTVVSLLEIGTPYLANMSESDFQDIRRLIQRVQNLLWVTSPAHHGESYAHYALAIGFFRGIRTEESSKHLVSLTIESCALGNEGSFITQVLKSCFIDQLSSTELEFVVRDGQLLIGRLTREVQLDQERVDRIVPRLRSKSWQPGPPLKLSVGTAGMLDTLHFVQDDATQADILQVGEVEIAAAAWPVSFRDVLIALGRLSSQEGLGFECAGSITRIGPGCPPEYDLHVGDRVVIVSPGCMRSHPRAPAHAVFKIPDTLSLQDAVAAINPGMTAYHALINVARLQPGEKILIHSAAGSTGQMAIAIAQQFLGAEVFATVGFDDKKQLLIDRFGIPDDHIFYSRDTSFARGVIRMTGGRGVDVVLNSLSGDGLRASWECMAAYGRFIEIGKADIGSNSVLPMSGFAKNVSFSGVDLLHISLTDAGLSRSLVSKVLELVESGKIRVPGPLTVFPIGEVEGAFRHMQSGRNVGRTVVTMKDTDMVSKYTVQGNEWKFNANASYIIAGGFGGLGRFILRWMADRGAKNLIVPSRSGISSDEASRIVKELGERGCRVVAHRCDVASASDLSALLEECSTTLPSIRGCINAAMALQDSIFENMSHAQWSTTIRSKVNTSYNLHTLLPNNLDFFILLSSLAGIYGPVSQSNYAAGCTFQDALAHIRSSAGHPSSVALDLGWMRTIGIVAERTDYRRHRERAKDMDAVEEDDLRALLEHFCNPDQGNQKQRSQVLVGAVIPAHFRARGEEPPEFLDRPFVAGFDNIYDSSGKHTAGVAGASSEVTNPSILFAQASTPQKRSEVVVNALKGKLAHALCVDVEEVDARKGLSDYGVDSLMAVELRNGIRIDFGANVAIFEIMGGVPIIAIGQLVVKKVAGK
ncbi:uncharacterized protein GGS22DRAFT_182315 [Annulohypoxylon maeteangense]|uniref:uncharacterized protein n=1 Tax=Annulohypoxylon maeteangense TaxID=1927788 RepID=UPI002007EAEF|nr:uncharacterized protein GGS22DRAFT_182315 [Annulohypoxylon maeteangense]KAI0880462.1 hypothetical protein GGS22DRAFT_182315 [Annulohypoxylon maeteangense]